MTTYISLYSDKNEEFQRIKQEIEDRTGVEPSNTEVVVRLMEAYRDQHGTPPGPGGLKRKD